MCAKSCECLRGALFMPLIQLSHLSAHCPTPTFPQRSRPLSISFQKLGDTDLFSALHISFTSPSHLALPLSELEVPHSQPWLFSAPLLKVSLLAV